MNSYPNNQECLVSESSLAPTSLNQHNMGRFHHTSSSYLAGLPTDPFSALETDMMYVPEVVTS